MISLLNLGRTLVTGWKRSVPHRHGTASQRTDASRSEAKGDKQQPPHYLAGPSFLARPQS
jgi:hypothetical protein